MFPSFSHLSSFPECSTKLKQAGERAESSDTEKSSLKIELESLRAKNTELSSILVCSSTLMCLSDFFLFRMLKK